MDSSIARTHQSCSLACDFIPQLLPNPLSLPLLLLLLRN